MNGKLRILSLIDDLGFGGGENRLLSLAQEIDRHHFEHWILTIQQPDPFRARSWAMRQQYAAAGLHVHSLGETPTYRRTRMKGPHLVRAMASLLRKVKKLIRFIRHQHVDLIDAHLEPASLVGVLAGVATRTPTVVTLYYAAPMMSPILWTLMGQAIMTAASTIITDSDAARRDMQKWMRRRHQQVLVIPNGILPPQTSRSRAEMKSVLGLPGDPRTRVISQIAGLAPYKGQMVLLDAARIVLEKAPFAAFLMVGFVRDLPFKDRLEWKIYDRGLAPRVRLVSYPGPVGDVWTTTDVQVHASLRDSLPNAIIEGMSLAKPIVATSVGGVPELLQHMQSGFLVPPDDPEALADGLLALLRDPSLAGRLGQAAFDRYVERCHASVMARALEQCFSRLAG